MIKKETPEVNAGSMADIAFLLLIFFLVTTTLETDKGLDRSLPPDQDPPPIAVHERNVLRVGLNDENLLLVEGEILDLVELTDLTVAFLDNGGLPIGTLGHCAYCKGETSPVSSDSPQKAIIYLEHTRATSYGTYIAVQNSLVAAYNSLRNRESVLLYKETYETLQQRYYDANTTPMEKVALRSKIADIRQLYPQKIIEPQSSENPKL